MQSRKPDEIEGWEPPQFALEDAAAGTGDSVHSQQLWMGWEGEDKGSTRYSSLTSSASSARWSLRSAGRLVSLRRQSKGHLADAQEEVDTPSSCRAFPHEARKLLGTCTSHVETLCSCPWGTRQGLCLVALCRNAHPPQPMLWELDV
ncbi:Hypothetical predicted protein [Marmota monax]|uniref:Uncharacterized protein n=1 Tax=Marmota monax TaxID=9995 RepID=A0A5E4B1M9_MARMO|nr:Hypothetical predicted protein [Marmota monax]